MRAAILSLSFLPFLYYGTKDTIFHLRGRKVSRTEHLLHAAIGVLLIILFSHAIMAHHAVVVGALILFAIVGGADEYIYHHGIPAEESDLHAKEHLALLIFVVMSLATDWGERNGWNWTQMLAQLQSASKGTP